MLLRFVIITVPTMKRTVFPAYVTVLPWREENVNTQGFGGYKTVESMGPIFMVTIVSPKLVHESGGTSPENVRFLFPACFTPVGFVNRASDTATVLGPQGIGGKKRDNVPFRRSAGPSALRRTKISDGRT